MTCPGSIAFTRDIPNPPSKYAAEGSAAHTVAARAFTYEKPAAFFLGEQIEHDGHVFVVDEEMALHVQLYLDEVHARIGKGTFLFEQKVFFSDAIGVPDQSGTSDAIILSEDGKTVQVGDLKYGMGVKVIAEGNEQLLTYAGGVLETFEAVMPDVENVVVFIVQPRLDHIDEWKCSVELVRAHMQAAKLAAAAAESGLAALDAGAEIPANLFRCVEDACRFCPGKATCPTYRQTVSALVCDDFQVLDDPGVLDVVGVPSPPADKLGDLFGVLDLIEGWCRGVRSEVERRVFAGEPVIGPDGKPMKLIEGKRGNRAWIDEEAAAALLQGFVPQEKLYKPRQMVSPAVIGKLYDKKSTAGQWEIIKPLFHQAPGKAKIALGSDPAPAYSGAASADEFADIGGED